MLKDKELSEKKLQIRPISPTVSILPPLREVIVDKLTNELRTEMQQNLQLYRGKRGYDTFFDTSEGLVQHLQRYLAVQEKWLQIDPDSKGVKALLDTPEEKMTELEKFMYGHL